MRSSHLLTRAVLVVAILLVFWQASGYGFVNLDDDRTVALNPLMNPPTLHSLKVWWTQPCLQLYDPLTASVRGGVAVLAQAPPDPNTGYTLNPRVFHRVNLVLHVGVTLVVYQLLLCCRVRPWPACGGAMLFAIHPLQVEPVVWITSIKDLLFCGFGFLAIWRFLAAIDAVPATPASDATPRDRRGQGLGNYLFATICLLLAMLSKPTAVILPLVSLPLIWARWGRIPRHAWRGLVVWAS